MPQFKVHWTETFEFEALVEADNLDQAEAKVKDDPSAYSFKDPKDFNGHAVEGCMEINHYANEQVNHPETGYMIETGG